MELFNLFSIIYKFLEINALKLGIPNFVFDLAIMFVITVIVLVFILLTVLFLVWWERKISAHIQVRFGPMRTGLWHGWAQTIADAIKLFLKEDIVPSSADRWVHLFAPFVVFIPAFMCWAVVPFGKNLIPVDLNIGVLYLLAVSSIGVVGIIMAGWGSNNKYTLLGGMRSAAQMVSYEIPRVFSVIPVIIFAEGLQISKIIQAQEGYRWFVFYPVIGQIAFFIYFISSAAECNRTPFDLPEAESELVAGFNTEYSGLKFSFFFLSEFANMFLVSIIGTTLFLGGGEGPILPSTFWLFAKTYFLVFVFMWFRWTFPRIRIDRLMDFNWKFLLPWSFANIFITGLWVVLR